MYQFLSKAPARLSFYLEQIGSFLARTRKQAGTAGAGGRVVFAAGLAVYLLVQVGLIVVVTHRREVPVEADDAYVHILRAEQMRTCFRQDCPALEDLRSRLLTTPDGAPTPSLIRSEPPRVSRRLF